MGVPALREDVRESILDAADRLFQHFGYKKTTVEDIATEAGVSRGTVYLYFKSKEEVALSWLARCNNMLRAKFQAIATESGSPAARVKAILFARVLLRFEAAQRYAQSVDDLFSALRPAVLSLRECTHEVEAEIIAGVLREGKQQGIFAFEDALMTARLLVTATNSLLPYSLSPRQLGEREELLSKLEGITALLLDGVHTR